VANLKWRLLTVYSNGSDVLAADTYRKRGNLGRIDSTGGVVHRVLAKLAKLHLGAPMLNDNAAAKFANDQWDVLNCAGVNQRRHALLIV